VEDRKFYEPKKALIRPTHPFLSLKPSIAKLEDFSNHHQRLGMPAQVNCLTGTPLRYGVIGYISNIKPCTYTKKSYAIRTKGEGNDNGDRRSKGAQAESI